MVGEAIRNTMTGMIIDDARHEEVTITRDIQEVMIGGDDLIVDTMDLPDALNILRKINMGADHILRKISLEDALGQTVVVVTLTIDTMIDTTIGSMTEDIVPDLEAEEEVLIDCPWSVVFVLSSLSHQQVFLQCLQYFH